MPNFGFPKLWKKCIKTLNLNNSTARAQIQVIHFLLAQYDNNVKCRTSPCRQCHNLI